jgi:hypothetical protein
MKQVIVAATIAALIVTGAAHAQGPDDINKPYCQQAGKIAKLAAQARDAGVTRATAIGDVVASAERDFVNRPADCQSEEEVEMRADVGWVYAHPKASPATCERVSFEGCMKYHGPTRASHLSYNGSPRNTAYRLILSINCQDSGSDLIC